MSEHSAEARSSLSRRQLFRWSAGAIAAGTLGACARGGNGAVAGGTATQSEAVLTEAASGPLNANMNPSGSETLPPYLQIFQEQYGRPAKLSVVADEYHTVTETRLRSGDTIDAVMADDGYLAKWRRSDWIADLDGMPGLENMQADMLPSLVGASKVDGKTVALPGSVLTKVMVYNTKLLDEAGVQPAESWDEFFDQLVDMKANGVANYPYVPMWTKAWGLTTYFAIGDSYSRGAEQWFDPDTFAPRYQDDPKVIETIEFWQRVWEADLVPPDVLTGDHNATTAIFSTGEHAYFQHNFGQVMPVLNNDPEQYPAVAGNVQIMLYPGDTHECLTGTNWMCLTKAGASRNGWILTRFLGGTDKEEEYLLPKEWRALDNGFETGYRPVLEDPEVVDAWSEFTDVSVLLEQQQKARVIGPVTGQEWFTEWLDRTAAELQSAIIGEKSATEALEASAQFASA